MPTNMIQSPLIPGETSSQDMKVKEDAWLVETGAISTLGRENAMTFGSHKTQSKHAMPRSESTFLAEKLTNLGLQLLVSLRGECWGETSKDNEEGNENGAKDNELAGNGLASAEISPHHAALANVLLERFRAKFVVDQTAQSNTVAESLEERHWVAEEEHGREDQENVL